MINVYDVYFRAERAVLLRLLINNLQDELAKEPPNAHSLLLNERMHYLQNWISDMDQLQDKP